MDLFRTTEPSNDWSKWTQGKAKLHGVPATNALKGDKLFDTFLKELTLAGYDVRRGFYTCQDTTTQFAEIYLSDHLVGMGGRPAGFIVWGRFEDRSGSSDNKRFRVLKPWGIYEEVFQDAQEAMDWVSDYIRSVDEAD